jgi:hypothetical protein
VVKKNVVAIIFSNDCIEITILASLSLPLDALAQNWL